jgi:hypothetical protein
MKIHQYQTICNVCDGLLSDKESTFIRVATPWLHLVRPHPEFLKYYTEILLEKKIKRKALAVYKVTRQMIGHIFFIIKCIFTRRNTWHSTNASIARTDLIIISHLVNEKQIGVEVDFYYGKTAQEIAKENINAVIVLINFTSIPAMEIAKRWGESNVARIILDKNLRVNVGVKLIISMLCESLVLRRKIKRATTEIERRILVRTSLEVCSSGTRWALKTALQISEIVKKLSPSAIMLTHEGHSWERVAFAAARDINPKIMCIGYQHSLVFNLQHALMRDLAIEYNPDLVLTAGKVGAELLKNLSLKKKHSVYVLGSPRPSVATEAINKKSLKDYLNNQLTCLVIPEGIIEECNILFEFSIKCALLIPGMHFIWRLHPSLSFEEITKQNTNLKILPANIYLSDRSIQDDINDSQISIYRGSTAIVTAVMAGVLPIYLEKPDEISIDALWQLDGSSRAVTTPEQFKNLIVLMGNTESREFSKVINKAQALCKELLLPLDPTQLVKGLQQGFNDTGFVSHSL